MVLFARACQERHVRRGENVKDVQVIGLKRERKGKHLEVKQRPLAL